MTLEPELSCSARLAPAAATEKTGAACGVLTASHAELLHQHAVVPAMFSLLGHIVGHHVLDLACGQGYVARRLAEHGAHVTAVDVSNELLKFARGRETQEPKGIIYHFSDPSDLQMIEDSTFDEVVCDLALMQIENLPGTVTEVARVIKMGGRFIFSINHPCFNAPGADAEDRNYFAEGPRPVNGPTGDCEQTREIHRTLSTYINAVAGRGFTIRRTSEPAPGEQLLADYPELDIYQHHPSALIFEAVFPRV